MPIASLRILIVLLVCFGSSSTIAQTDMVVGTTAGAPGDTVHVPVTLATTQDVTALQLDVGFDTLSLSVATPTGGDALGDHAVASHVPSAGVLRMVVYSPTNAPLANGTLATIPFTIAPDAGDGSARLELSAVVLADPNAQGVTPSNLVSGSIGIFTDVPTTDLAVTVDDGTDVAILGASLTYTITVENLGFLEAKDAIVSDVFPAALLAPVWTCAASLGSSCTAGPVTGNVADVVHLAAGGALAYTVTATVDPTATGSLSNTASISVPAELTDPNPANNSATDVDSLSAPPGIFADGFESGDLTAWSSASRFLFQSAPLKMRLRPGEESSVEEILREAESRLRLRFSFDPSSATMEDGASHRIFAGYSDDGPEALFSIDLGRFDGWYHLRVSALTDGGERFTTSWAAIADQPNELEIEWWAAGPEDTDGGGLLFWVNGAFEASLTGLENAGQKLRRLRAGAFGAVHPTSRGSHVFAEFSRLEVFASIEDKDRLHDPSPWIPPRRLSGESADGDRVASSLHALMVSDPHARCLRAGVGIGTWLNF